MAQKWEVRIVKVEDAYKSILGKLQEMDSRLVGMDHVIRGNGRPGLVAKAEVIDQRLKNLETNKRDWKDLIAMIVGGGLVAVFTALLQHFIH